MTFEEMKEDFLKTKGRKEVYRKFMEYFEPIYIETGDYWGLGLDIINHFNKYCLAPEDEDISDLDMKNWRRLGEPRK